MNYVKNTNEISISFELINLYLFSVKCLSTSQIIKFHILSFLNVQILENIEVLHYLTIFCNTNFML